MAGNIVLYGATGFMGSLTARAMAATGARPVLAGRDRGRLDELAARLAQETARRGWRRLSRKQDWAAAGTDRAR